MNTVYVKSGDTAIEFTSDLVKDGAAADLTGASAVYFVMKKDGVVFRDTATVEDAEAGSVSYIPGTGFPTNTGLWKQEWEVYFSGSLLTFPTGGHNSVIITPSL